MIKNYTEEELLNNYHLFIDILKRSITGDRLDALLHMYSEDELGFELMMAPASGKKHYHCAYPGGYIDHILNVVQLSLKMSKLFEDSLLSFGNINEPSYTREELLFAAFHHDLGKIGDVGMPYYEVETNKWQVENRGSVYKSNEKLTYMEVSHRTLYLLNKYGVTYTENEMLGIILADGLYQESNKRYLMTTGQDRALRTDLPYILHWADHMATRVEHYDYIKNHT